MEHGITYQGSWNTEKMSGLLVIASTGHQVIPKYVLCVWLLNSQMKL